MLSKTWYNLHIYIGADYKKTWFFTPTPVFYACRYSFAMSAHVCNLSSKDFVKISRFECCFWSAQCIETQARMSDNVITWVFISLNVQWWSFIDNYLSGPSGSLRFATYHSRPQISLISSILLAPVLVRSWIESWIPKKSILFRFRFGSTTFSQSDWLSAKIWVWLTKRWRKIKSWVKSVPGTGLLADVCSKLHKETRDYCLFNMSYQLVVGIDFGWFWLKNYKNIVLRYSMTDKQYFCVEELLK